MGVCHKLVMNENEINRMASNINPVDRSFEKDSTVSKLKPRLVEIILKDY